MRNESKFTLIAFICLGCAFLYFFGVVILGAIK